MNTLMTLEGAKETVRKLTEAGEALVIDGNGEEVGRL